MIKYTFFGGGGGGGGGGEKRGGGGGGGGRGSITYGTDQANKVNKMFIVWL